MNDWIERKLSQLIKAAAEGDDAMVAAMETRIEMYVHGLEEKCNEH